MIQKLNRVSIDGNIAKGHANDRVYFFDISDLNNPFITSYFTDNSGIFSTGSEVISGNRVVAAWGVGVKILNYTDPYNVIDECFYYNDQDFVIGTNAAIHDVPVFSLNGSDYILVTLQNQNSVAFLKMN